MISKEYQEILNDLGATITDYKVGAAFNAYIFDNILFNKDNFRKCCKLGKLAVKTDLKSIRDIYDYIIEECKSFYGSSHELDYNSNIPVRKALDECWVFSDARNKKNVIDEWCFTRGEYFLLIEDTVYYLSQYNIDRDQKQEW